MLSTCFPRVDALEDRCLWTVESLDAAAKLDVDDLECDMMLARLTILVVSMLKRLRVYEGRFIGPE
jgi:hypothetical protein